MTTFVLNIPTRKGPVTLTGKGYGANGRVTLEPGSNNVPTRNYNKFKVDRVFSHWLREGYISFPAEAKAAVAEELKQVEKEIGVLGWIPTDDQLGGLTGVGSKTIGEIRKVQPKNGFVSTEQFYKLTNLANVDIDELEAVFSHG